MKMFARRKPATVPDRRSIARVRVDCVAMLIMPSGNRAGRLFDISTHGARFVTQDPPARDVSAILEWHSHDAYCHIIWTKPGMCGVEFDRPIPAKVVDDLAGAAPAGPRLVQRMADDGTDPEKGCRPAPPARFVG
ncbi:PilZ domain-containing protein [Aurantiacibacter poecillastricola]|uniref:PilZ domain-containing protein n=1 Tax=Aurantiacibacter poecillastricola TaxID=3064385 RepID=UPI0027401340|nr:PilZ domain-containing protein [Aurantiacibacter sp. 219JJ12-13]MDP5261894.1 PilZ domain-containing protein [Aurantiacibacter sp. 219JJ12-13]